MELRRVGRLRDPARESITRVRYGGMRDGYRPGRASRRARDDDRPGCRHGAAVGRDQGPAGGRRGVRPGAVPGGRGSASTGCIRRSRNPTGRSDRRERRCIKAAAWVRRSTATSRSARCACCASYWRPVIRGQGSLRQRPAGPTGTRTSRLSESRHGSARCCRPRRRGSSRCLGGPCRVAAASGGCGAHVVGPPDRRRC